MHLIKRTNFDKVPSIVHWRGNRGGPRRPFEAGWHRKVWQSACHLSATLERTGVGSPNGLLNRRHLRVRRSMRLRSAARLARLAVRPVGIGEVAGSIPAAGSSSRAGKGAGCANWSVKPVSSGEWIDTTPAHHASFVQRQDTRPITVESSVQLRDEAPITDQ